MEDFLLALIVVAAIALGLILIGRWGLAREVVHENDLALLYRNGRFDGMLDTGAHWIMPFRDTIERIDRRRRDDVISGQEILTKDRIAIKISLVLGYTPADAHRIQTESATGGWALLEDARLALRAVVADMELDAVLDARGELGDRVKAALGEPASARGFTLDAVAIRDIMLPGNLKRAYAGVLEAQKEAERRLEQARGEQAVMRSLANTARMLEKNPSLVQARVLQSLDAGGNTVVFGADRDAAVLGQSDDEGSGQKG